MAVIPGHKVCSSVGPIELDTRDVQGCVFDGTGRENDRVIELAQILQLEVFTKVHIGQQTNVTAVQHLMQGGNDLFDPRVIGSYSVSHQTKRRRQPIKEIYRDV